MTENRLLERLLRLLWLTLCGLGLWLGVTVFLPWILPFLLAALLAALLEPAVAALIRARLPRWAAAALCTAALVLLAAALLTLVLWRAGEELTDLLDELPVLLERLGVLAGKAEHWIYRFLIAAPPALREMLTAAMASFSPEKLELSGVLYRWMGQAVSWLADVLPGAILFLFTTALATYFTSASRPAVLRFLSRQLPERWREQLGAVRVQLRDALGGWLRAQGLLMLITFGELLLGLLVLRVRPALLLAGITAAVDALPVFGTGTILLPWAAVCMMTGQPGRAVGLLVLYGIICLARSLLEPKLLGTRMGLHPLAALCAMYVGFQAFGVAGMLLGPLALALLRRLHTGGLLHLWRE